MKEKETESEEEADAGIPAKEIDISINTPFNKTVVKLFQIIGKLYLDNNLKVYYTVKRFKAYLALYFGFKAESINLQFNFLESIGIIRIQRKAKKGDPGGLMLDVEKLLEYHDNKKVFTAWMEQKTEERKKMEKEADELLKKMQGAERDVKKV